MLICKIFRSAYWFLGFFHAPYVILLFIYFKTWEYKVNWGTCKDRKIHLFEISLYIYVQFNYNSLYVHIHDNLVMSKTILQENLRWASEVQAISRTIPNTKHKEDALMISDLKLKSGSSIIVCLRQSVSALHF